MKMSDSIVQRVVARIASWDVNGPMDGTAMDLLHDVERLDPRKAGNLIEKWLKDREAWSRYSAMGVWDVVMSGRVQIYKDVFKFLNIDVGTAARKGFPDEGDGGGGDREVEKFLRRYRQGEPTGKLRQKFVPKGGHAGHVFYISNVDFEESGELKVEMTNQFTDERETVEEYFEPPIDIERTDYDEYGAKGDKQQSIVLKVEDYDGNEWEMQVELDATTGKFRDRMHGTWEQI